MTIQIELSIQPGKKYRTNGYAQAVAKDGPFFIGSTFFLMLCPCSMSAAASGTFIYVAVVDTLVPEFANPSDRGSKFGMCLIGV